MTFGEAEDREVTVSSSDTKALDPRCHCRVRQLWRRGLRVDLARVVGVKADHALLPAEVLARQGPVPPARVRRREGAPARHGVVSTVNTRKKATLTRP